MPGWKEGEGSTDQRADDKLTARLPHPFFRGVFLDGLGIVVGQGFFVFGPEFTVRASL